MRPYLLAVVLVLAAPTALAQELQIPHSPSHTLVTFTLRATFSSPDGVAVPAVLTKLSEDGHLASLDVSSRGATHNAVDAEFVFGSVSEYAAWRESAGTVALIRDLETNSVQEITANVSVRRRALTRFLPQTD